MAYTGNQNDTEELKLGFEKGELKRCNDQNFVHPADAIQYLQS
jgi:argininosuccinate synthase